MVVPGGNHSSPVKSAIQEGAKIIHRRQKQNPTSAGDLHKALIVELVAAGEALGHVTSSVGAYLANYCIKKTVLDFETGQDA